MSIAASQHEIDFVRRLRIATAAFVVLLVLSVLWPSPIVETNRLCCDAPLAVDELSFLGREAPSWDVVYWFFAGIFLIALLQTGRWTVDDFVAPLRALRAMRLRFTRATIIALIAGTIAVAMLWRFVDGAAIALAEQIQSPATENAIRIVNRFGGGMNPALIVGFFFVTGIVYRRPRWTTLGVAMAIAGLAAGVGAQILKALIGRSRPELWQGPFDLARTSASSFPSGHTVGAFALAGVLAFGARSIPLRIVAITLATAVGVSRILAFRHWLSDVAASACLGLLAAHIVLASVTSVTKDQRESP